MKNAKYVKIAPDVELGENVQIYDFVNLYGCKIGSGTRIGTFVEIQKNATVGENCKISSHTFICEGVTIGNGCFIGHGVLFINDKHPRAVNADSSLQTEDDWQLLETQVEDNVSIGSGAIIMGGIRLGKGCLIGAGAVVTRDVAPGRVVAGVPARIVSKNRDVE